jgi:hypothetical protein
LYNIKVREATFLSVLVPLYKKNYIFLLSLLSQAPRVNEIKSFEGGKSTNEWQNLLLFKVKKRIS